MRRVAITGLGVVSPVGVGQDAFWQGLLRPQPAGERRVHDFDPSRAYDDPKAIRRADRFEQFAIASAQEALAQAGPLTASPERTGVLVGTGIGGADVHEEQTKVLVEKGGAARLAVHRSDDDVECGRGGDLDPLGLPGSLRNRRDRLRDRHPRDRPGDALDPVGPVRRRRSPAPRRRR